MKVNIYRVLFFVLLGLLVGFGSGSYLTARTFLNNIPPSTEVSIGKIKVKGKNNQVTDVIDYSESTEETVEKKERKGLFRRK